MKPPNCSDGEQRRKIPSHRYAMPDSFVTRGDIFPERGSRPLGWGLWHGDKLSGQTGEACSARGSSSGAVAAYAVTEGVKAKSSSVRRRSAFIFRTPLVMKTVRMPDKDADNRPQNIGPYGKLRTELADAQTNIKRMKVTTAMMMAAVSAIIQLHLRW